MRFAFVIIETEHSRRHVRERRADYRARIEAWMGEQARAGALVGGEAFETEAMAPVTVRCAPDGGAVVTEGPFGGEAETLGGHLLMAAVDRDGAIAPAATWPTDETIEVRPIWSPT